MTERWRRELEHLGEIHPPDAFWKKVTSFGEGRSLRMSRTSGTFRAAGIAVVAVLLLAGIALPLWALLPLGDHDKPRAAVTSVEERLLRTYTSSARWSWDYPYAPWYVGGGRGMLHDDGEYHEYHYLSNLDVIDGRAAFVNGGVIDDFDALSPDSVVLELWGFGRGDEWADEPDTPLPVTVDVAPGESETVTVYDQGRRFDLTLTANPEASEEDIATATRVLESLRFTEGAGFRGQPWTDEEGITSAVVPVGWGVADEPLTPHLLDPGEVASFGTFDMAPNRAGQCAHLPVQAVLDMGPTDSLVMLSERTMFGDGLGTKPPLDADTRPSPFNLDVMGGGGEWPQCIDDHVGIMFRHQNFDQSGRSFLVYVAMGQDAARDSEQRAKVEALLDSLVIDPRTAGPSKSPEAIAAPNPCDLLHSWEVEDELDINLNEVRPMGADEFLSPPKPWPDGFVACKYGSDGRVGDVVVSLQPMTLEGFRSQYVERDWAEHLDGPGKEAVFSACASVFAWQDGLTLQVGLQRGRCEDKRALARLASFAFDRTDGISQPQT
jgi:hypothetical protein